ncbi:MAG: COG1615 family transporter, partial [Leptolyngbya sp. SIO4C1]|nr:COG1615 family transporter [Leptolyngbya sp. SIO4C1]
FYNREDQWRAPNEIYANEEQVVEPYYLIMRLPQAEEEEFVLLRPFTPAQRNNMVAWLAARSDDEQYGRILLYRFPKQELVFGPEQIEARINQDPEISQRISLWDTQGSRANQGNLLVIPIEQSLLYVEPLYLEAEQNRLPILARVIVAYRNRIAMAETLEQALEAVFLNRQTSSPAILRDLESSDAGEGILTPDPDVAVPPTTDPLESSELE